MLAVLPDTNIHRLPHEFKVGDWFEYTDARKSLGVMRAETEIFCEYARHVPPPKEILCECEYGLQGEDHAKGCPEIAAVETSENPFKGPHWDRKIVPLMTREDHMAWERDCDLRDEFLRMRGGE